MLDKITNVVKNVMFLWGTFWVVFTGSMTYLSVVSDFVTSNFLEVISVSAVGILFTIAHFVHKKDHLKLHKQHDVLESKLDKLVAMVTTTTDKAASKWEDVIDTQKHIRVKMLKADIDNLYRQLQDKDTITEDEAKYIYELDECRIELGVNSFTERKIKAMLEKDIVV